MCPLPGHGQHALNLNQEQVQLSDFTGVWAYSIWYFMWVTGKMSAPAESKTEHSKSLPKSKSILKTYKVFELQRWDSNHIHHVYFWFTTKRFSHVTESDYCSVRSSANIHLRVFKDVHFYSNKMKKTNNFLSILMEKLKPKERLWSCWRRLTALY